jgi:hypothetical protein
MPIHSKAAHSDDRCSPCELLTACAQANGECGRVARISRRRPARLSPLRAIRRAGDWPHDRARILESCVSEPDCDAEGVGR